MRSMLGRKLWSLKNSFVPLHSHFSDFGSSTQGYTTARTLLSILRLSEALARLRWAEQVCVVGDAP